MKILALGDPHGFLPKNLNALIKKNKIRTIICVGDVGFVPEKPWLKESWKGVNMNNGYERDIDKLASLGLPVLILRGDTLIRGGKKFADRVLRKHKNVVNKFTGQTKVEGQNFIFFDISFEKETMKPSNKTKFFINKMRRNKNRERKLNQMLKENPRSVIISHNPPYGVVDQIPTGKHVGSKILLRAIKKHQPKLVLCGHIHEAKGKAKIGKTEVYNLGSHGNYKIFDI